MKDLKNGIAAASLKVKTAVTLGLTSVALTLTEATQVFAGPQELPSNNPLNKDTTGIWNAAAAIYVKWAIPFIAALALAWAFAPLDDKKKEMIKKALIGMIVAYVIFYVFNGENVQALLNWFGSLFT